jgi:hypothetical protein
MAATAAATTTTATTTSNVGNGSGSRRPAASIYELTEPQREELRGVFLSLIVAGPNGCHMWIGHQHPRGYGLVHLFSRRWYAHRLGLEFAKGPIPPGMFALHGCNQPRCVNGNHLRAGTAWENMQDKIASGCDTRGENNRNALFSEAVVANIKWLAHAGVPQQDIADHYGISHTMVSKINLGETWGWVTPLEPPPWEPAEVVGIRRRL